MEALDDSLELTLKMALEPDLRLRFYDAASFSTWKKGFEVLQQLLFSPGSVSSLHTKLSLRKPAFGCSCSFGVYQPDPEKGI